MFRFVSSTIILQLFMGGIVFGALRDGTSIAAMAIGVYVLISSVLFSIWLKSQAEIHNHKVLSKHKDKFAKEREDLRVKAERDKLKVVKDAQKEITKQTNRHNAKANFKVGAVVAGAVGIGGLLIISQMMTLGLLAMTTAGGGLAGYLFRTRQEKNLLSADIHTGQKLSAPKVIKTISSDKS